MSATQSILLVTLSRETGQQLARFLGELGYAARLEIDAQAAWRSFAEQPPELILIEASPQHDETLALVRRIRRDPVGAVVPVAALIPKEFDPKILVELQADLVLHRPLRPKELKEELIQTISEGRGPLREALQACGPPSTREEDEARPLREPIDDEEQSELVEKRQGGLWSPPPMRDIRRSSRPTLFADQGRLEQVSVPELLADLYLSRFNGSIRFTRGRIAKGLMLIDGSVVYVESYGRNESLGQILVREGVISERDCLLSIANMRAYATRQGGALIEMGAITPLQLMVALRLQAWLKALALFGWFEGDYLRVASEVDPTRYSAFGLDTPQLIRQGVSRCYSPETLKALFDQAKSARFKLDERSPIRADSLGLSEPEDKFLGLFDGAATVEQIVFTSPLELGPSLQLLYWLIALEVIAPAAEASPQQLRGLDEARCISELQQYQRNLESMARAAHGQQAAPAPPPPLAGGGAALDFKSAAERAAGGGPAPRPDPAEPDSALAADIAAAERVVRDAGPDQISDPHFVPAAEAMQIKPRLDQLRRDGQSDVEGLKRLITAKFLEIESGTHYDMLGLKPDDSPELIERNYSRLARRLRPERLGDLAAPELIEKARAVAARLDQAFLVLGDPQRRRDYDARLSGALHEQKRRQAEILVAESSFNRAIQALKLGEFGRAVEALRKTVELFPDESEYHAFLGWALFNDQRLSEQERVRQAKQELTKANELNPKSDKSCLFLGKMLKAAGKLHEAAQMFAQAVTRNPQGREARSELELLDFWAPKDFTMPPEPAPTAAEPERSSEFTSAKAAIKRVLTKG